MVLEKPQVSTYTSWIQSLVTVSSLHFSPSKIGLELLHLLNTRSKLIPIIVDVSPSKWIFYPSGISGHIRVKPSQDLNCLIPASWLPKSDCLHSLASNHLVLIELGGFQSIVLSSNLRSRFL